MIVQPMGQLRLPQIHSGFTGMGFPGKLGFRKRWSWRGREEQERHTRYLVQAEHLSSVEIPAGDVWEASGEHLYWVLYCRCKLGLMKTFSVLSKLLWDVWLLPNLYFKPVDQPGTTFTSWLLQSRSSAQGWMSNVIFHGVTKLKKNNGICMHVDWAPVPALLFVRSGTWVKLPDSTEPHVSLGARHSSGLRELPGWRFQCTLVFIPFFFVFLSICFL